MLKTTKLLTITVPKATYREIQGEAKKRKTTVSGLLRTAFSSFVEKDTDLYSDAYLEQIFKRDTISTKLQKDLNKLLER